MSLTVGSSSLPLDSFSDLNSTYPRPSSHLHTAYYRCAPSNPGTALHHSHADGHSLPASRIAANNGPAMAPPPHMRPPPSIFGEEADYAAGFDALAPPIAGWGASRGPVAIRSGDDEDQERHVPLAYCPPPLPPRGCAAHPLPAAGVTIRKGSDDDFENSQACPLAACSGRQVPPHLLRADPAFPAAEYGAPLASAPFPDVYPGYGDPGSQRFDGASRNYTPRYAGAGPGGSPQMDAGGSGGLGGYAEWAPQGYAGGSNMKRGRRSLDGDVGGNARMAMGGMGMRGMDAVREMGGMAGMAGAHGVYASRSYDETRGSGAFGDPRGTPRAAMCGGGGGGGGWDSRSRGSYGSEDVEGRRAGNSGLSLKEELAAFDGDNGDVYGDTPLRSSQRPNSDESWNQSLNPSCEYTNDHPNHRNNRFSNLNGNSDAYLSADFSVYPSSAGSSSLRIPGRHPTSGYPPADVSREWWATESDAGSVNGGGGGGGGDCRLFSEEQLAKATDNWSPSNHLGKGAFGTVYKGRVLGCQVAVKRLEGGSWQGPEEYTTEVEVLSRMRHPHIVLLMGHCPDAMCLVYEYLPAGSLQDHLNALANPGAGRRVLSVVERVRVLSEVASALLFLHHHDPPIAHRDLKPDNVLLDTNRCSKLADVGLARLIADDDNVTARVRGTVGYIDPEEMVTFEISVQSDVYALGLMMLQLLVGEPSIKALHRRIRPFQDALDTHWQQRGARAAEAGNSGGYSSGGSGGSSSSSPMVQAVAALVSEHLDRSGGEWPLSIACQLAEWGLKCAARQRACRPDLAGELHPALSRLVEEVEAGERERRQCIEDQFVCPLSHERMTEPVVAADGFTYERSSIEEWLITNDTSPSTGEPLPHKHLTSNHALRMLLQSR